MTLIKSDITFKDYLSTDIVFSKLGSLEGLYCDILFVDYESSGICNLKIATSLSGGILTVTPTNYKDPILYRVINTDGTIHTDWQTSNTFDLSAEPEATLFIVQAIDRFGCSEYATIETETLPFDSSYSLLTNGTNQYVDTGFLDGTILSNLTIEGWFKTTSTAIQSIAGCRDVDGPTQILKFWLNQNEFQSQDAGKIFFQIRDADGFQYVLATSNSYAQIYDGNWHHVAVTKDINNNYKIYLDGTDLPLSTTTTENPDSFTAFDYKVDLGAWNNRNIHENFFNGNLFEVRFWNEVRTQQQIQDNKDQSLDPATDYPTDYPNLKLYYQMTDASGNTLTDTIGTSSGTLQNNTGDNMWDQDVPTI